MNMKKEKTERSNGDFLKRDLKVEINNQKPGRITAYLKRMTTNKGMDKMKRYARPFALILRCCPRLDIQPQKECCTNHINA